MADTPHYHHHDKVITVAKRQWWLTVSAALSFALILLGAATLVFIQEPIQESQDLRQQASVTDGQVRMAFAPPTGANIPVDQTTSVNFQLNTQNVQIDGVQLVFNVITDTLTEAPEFNVASGSGIQQIYQQAQQVTDGYLVTVALISQTVAQPVSTSDFTTIGQLNFTPTTTGSIEINFDEDYSISTVFNSTPPTDELRNIDALTYNVVEVASPSPIASPSVSPAVSPSPSASPIATPEVSPSPTATPLVTPTPTPAVGGATVSCNQSCTLNADCQANHRCYNGQCRLVTNVSSTTCNASPDNGLNRSCNQYCADSRECASGYSCYFNRCRNPLNVENTSCTAPTQQVSQSMSASCNRACNTHKDCAANLFCHSSGTCRLVTNPSSTSCTPAAYSTVSNMYNTKGGVNGPTKTDGVSPSSTTKPGSATTSATPRVTSSPQPDANTGSEDELPLQKKSAFDSLREYFMTQLNERGISLPMFFIGLGLALLLIVILFSLVMRMLASGSNQPPVIMPVGRARDKEKDTKYENQLASKINSLQQSQSSSPAPMPSPLPPSAMVRVPADAPTTVTPAQMAPAPTPSPLPQAPTPTAPEPTQPSSSMMARLQDKGIKPPQG